MHSQVYTPNQSEKQILRRGVAHKLEEQLLSIRARTCRVCGRELSNEDSIIAGVGPECRKIAAAEQATGERFPVGCEVRITSGFREGRIGIVEKYEPRRHFQALQRPFTVKFAGAITPGRWVRDTFSADELERIEVES